jgi:hypothetical protein
MSSTGSFPLMLVLMEHKLREFFISFGCLIPNSNILNEPDDQELLYQM